MDGLLVRVVGSFSAWFSTKRFYAKCSTYLTTVISKRVRWMAKTISFKPFWQTFGNCLDTKEKRFGTAFSNSDIASAKRFALRRRIWYRVLSRIERGVLDLTMKYVDCIRSAKLASLVSAIIGKLEVAAESVVDRLVRSVGFSMAQRISDLAVNWGYSVAACWASDVVFARYLAVAHLNSRF